MSSSIPQPLTCPFCGIRLSRPTDLEVESYEASPGNFCPGCGAAYALDHTSHNLGRVMLDAYCYAAGSCDKAMDLDPEKDLYEQIVRGYDEKTNTVLAPKTPRYTGAGGLYFVRLKPEAAERLAKED